MPTWNHTENGCGVRLLAPSPDAPLLAPFVRAQRDFCPRRAPFANRAPTEPTGRARTERDAPSEANILK
jgi:hypothetical protein